MDQDIISALCDFKSTIQESIFACIFGHLTLDDCEGLIRGWFGQQQLDVRTIKSATTSIQIGESVVVRKGSSLRYKALITAETAQSICMLMCGDETVTPTLSSRIQTALRLMDSLVAPSTPVAPILQARLREAAQEWHENALFQSHSASEDCPICCIPLPIEGNYKGSFRVCCGKTICLGCIWTVAEEGNGTPCPFCRSNPYQSNVEYLEWLDKLVKNKHTIAMSQLGTHYYQGDFGLNIDEDKAFQLWTDAGEAGGDNGAAYYNIATQYIGRISASTFHRVRYYYEKAAILGNVDARYQVAEIEKNCYQDKERSIRHYILAAEAGHKEAMKAVVKEYRHGDIQLSHDALERLLRKHHTTLATMTSDARVRRESAYRLSGLTNGV